MKDKKNKSSIYVFPKIYYKLIEEGLDKDIVNFIFDTYLTDENDKFTIVINKVNMIDGRELPSETFNSLISCKSIDDKYFEISPELITVKLKDVISDNSLIQSFTSGTYSSILEEDKSDILDFNFNNCSIEQYIKIGYILFRNKNYKDYLAEQYDISPDDFPENSELDSIIKLEEEMYDSDKEEEIKKSYSKVQ